MSSTKIFPMRFSLLFRHKANSFTSIMGFDTEKCIPNTCLWWLTLSTSSCVDLQLVRLVTSVTEPSASTARVFTGTDTILPVSTAVFKISVFCTRRRDWVNIMSLFYSLSHLRELRDGGIRLFQGKWFCISLCSYLIKDTELHQTFLKINGWSYYDTCCTIKTNKPNKPSHSSQSSRYERLGSNF